MFNWLGNINMSLHVHAEHLAVTVQIECGNYSEQMTPFNSSTKPSLVQIITSRLFCAKPLSVPMLAYYQLNPYEQTSLKLKLNTIFFVENAFENVGCRMIILSWPQCVKDLRDYQSGSHWIIDDIDNMTSVCIYSRHSDSTAHTNTPWRYDDDILTRKRFTHYWPFVTRFHLFPRDSPHKGPVMWSFDILLVVRLNKLLGW